MTAGAMVDVSLPDGRTLPVPALPLEMRGRRFGLQRDIPRVGEHGAEIARDLGLTETEIAELISENTLGKGDLPRTSTDTLPSSI